MASFDQNYVGCSRHHEPMDSKGDITSVGPSISAVVFGAYHFFCVALSFMDSDIGKRMYAVPMISMAPHPGFASTSSSGKPVWPIIKRLFDWLTTICRYAHWRISSRPSPKTTEASMTCLIPFSSFDARQKTGSEQQTWNSTAYRNIPKGVLSPSPRPSKRSFGNMSRG